MEHSGGIIHTLSIYFVCISLHGCKIVIDLFIEFSSFFIYFIVDFGSPEGIHDGNGNGFFVHIRSSLDSNKLSGSLVLASILRVINKLSLHN